MKHELPTTVRIEKVIKEAEGINSIFLPYSGEVKPGQFVMIWVPRVDTKPVGVSYQEKNLLGITVSAVGPWSNIVCEMKKGDLLGILGPYGNSFTLQGKKIVLIGGGYGAATLMLLAEQSLKRGIDTTLIIGAKTESQLLYRTRVADLGLETIFTTDDGSFGEKGYNTAILSRILKDGGVDAVYTCGPEQMEKKVAELCIEHKVPCQVSLERQMKCGFGICGACCMDDSGKRVCVEGTVFSAEEALGFKESENITETALQQSILFK